MTWNRILIADQKPEVRLTLVELLHENSEIVGAGEDEEGLRRALQALEPNVILLGVRLNGTTGFDVARRLRQAECKAKIIIVSLQESPDLARAALAIGASGYVFMSRLIEDLPAAVDAVCAGKVFAPK